MIDEEKKSLMIKLNNVDWQDFETDRSVKKDVKVEIHFSKDGFDKILGLMSED